MYLFEIPSEINNSQGTPAKITQNFWDNGLSYRIYVSYRFPDGSGGKLGYFDRRTGDFVDQSSGSAGRVMASRLVSLTQKTQVK